MQHGQNGKRKEAADQRKSARELETKDVQLCEGRKKFLDA